MPNKKTPVKRPPTKVTKAPPRAAARMKDDETPAERRKRLAEEKLRMRK
ncbi:MAG TPA: hypothetical protein VFA32_22555 [Dehalococcoidia bacterium]|nr:hypothetical protein [Dehalococcoidia bacterium]